MATHGSDPSNANLSKREIKTKLQKLEQGLDDLRRQYEQYFVGNRDRPPKQDRRQVERLVRELQHANMANTSHTFKFRSLQQRLTTYKNKWNRIERQIEEGTYQPHQERAQARLEDDEDAEETTDLDESTEPDTTDADGDEAYAIDLEMDDIDLEHVERELEAMDQQGEFEDYVDTERVDVETERDEIEAQTRADPQETRPEIPPSGDPSTTERGGSESDRRRDRLDERQDQLGLSKGGDDRQAISENKREKLHEARRRLREKRSEQSQETRSESTADLEETKRIEPLDEREEPSREHDRASRRDRDRGAAHTSESSSGTQTSQRRGSSDRGRSHSSDRSSSSDDDEDEVRELHRRLMSAREARDQATDITLEAFERALRTERTRLSHRRRIEPECISFRVVLKEGQAYLQANFEAS